MIKKQLRKVKYLLLRLLRIKDKSHSIARGFTIGFLMNFVPTFGFGPFLSTVLPRLIKGNVIAGFIGGIAFLWAFPFLFYLNIIVGESVLPFEISEVLEEVNETDGEPEEAVIEVGLTIGKAFIIGMIINMFLIGGISYIVIYTVVKKFRREVLMFVFKQWKL